MVEFMKQRINCMELPFAGMHRQTFGIIYCSRVLSTIENLFNENTFVWIRKHSSLFQDEDGNINIIPSYAFKGLRFSMN